MKPSTKMLASASLLSASTYAHVMVGSAMLDMGTPYQHVAHALLMVPWVTGIAALAIGFFGFASWVDGQ